ncbi:class I SAM-dependent methyltransferase [Bacillus wiedmannii]|uniref:class I SAM-dependent methyltransferase n=1 Tax=Bacillus wiedmannii TaxID=1890302 RepID=UPI000BF9F312|nr:class I SAM-dependent methyltransferase [Bacillus wiedmannii]PFY98373.1 methyltransferase [Bacillus wiedmannii]
MSRLKNYHENKNEYLQVMTTAFENHYKKRTDVWSGDSSLTEAGQIAFQVWLDQNKEGAAKILDIGCGNGRILRNIYGNIASYMGVDLYEQQEWKNIREEVKFPVDFTRGDFVRWSLNQQPQNYDVIFDHGCLHHQHPNEHITYLKSIGRLLAPEGIFSLVVWAESCNPDNIGEDGRFHFYFSQEKIKYMMHEAGLKLILINNPISKKGVKQYHAIAHKIKD